VELLRQRKRRARKPFAVMVPDVKTAELFCEIDEQAMEALTSRQCPIVLMPMKSGIAIADVAPGQHDLGLFLPYAPVHHLLFAAGNFQGLVMTSLPPSCKSAAVKPSSITGAPAWRIRCTDATAVAVS
jgi:hydrogenase maturation factor HypF (carbamoyltransferase family)